MSVVTSFAPWITFVGATSLFGWRAGLAAGLAALLVVMASSRRERIGVMNIGQLVFFVAVGGFAMFRPDAALQHHITTASTAWFATVALVSLLVGRPFTTDFVTVSATGDVTPAIAASPLYHRIHMTITAVWSACFAAMAVAGLVSDASGEQSVRRLVTIVALAIAISFTTSYPDKAVAAHARLGEASPAVMTGAARH